MNPMFYLQSYLNGIGITLILMLAAIGIGLILAIAMTVISREGPYILKKCVNFFIFFIRGTPLLVQIFLIYYGAGQFEALRDSFFWIVFKTPMACAIIALSLNTACYTAIILMGAIQSVPKNEIDACDALGMSKSLALRRVIFPRAFRIALPAYSNEVLMILKSTSLASTITLLDVMGVTQQMVSATYDTVQWYLVAAVIYLLLTGVITCAFNHWQKRLNWNK